jgi:hypothetical protein
MTEQIVSQKGHTHYLGPTNLCWCGFKLVIPPICFSLQVYNKLKLIISDGFNCSELWSVAERLREIADELERIA